MRFGQIEIEDGAVHTHNDSYALSTITVVSARRPFLGAGFMIALGICGFTASFHDLLFIGEIVTSVAVAVACGWIGLCLGQLQLLSRDLRGSELSGAVWGRYRRLNNERRKIAKAARAVQTGDLS